MVLRFRQVRISVDASRFGSWMWPYVLYTMHASTHLASMWALTGKPTLLYIMKPYVFWLHGCKLCYLSIYVTNIL